MPDMYDKLGDLLNDALESGKIPKKDQNNVDSGLFSSKNHKADIKQKPETAENTKTNGKYRAKIPEEEQKPTAQVIKMHNYATFIQFPLYIQKALATLDIVYPFTADKLKKQYHQLLKEIHPDTKNTIQSKEDVLNNRQYTQNKTTIDDIKAAYNSICSYFNIK